MPGGTRKASRCQFDSNTNEGNMISVDKSKLKEDQKAELDWVVEAYKQECHKAFSASRIGDIMRKFEFPSPLPLTKSQHENRMIDMMYQEVSHAFINNIEVMTNSFQNAMVNAMKEGEAMKYFSLFYQQPIPSLADTMGQGNAGDPSATEPIPLETILSGAHVFSQTPPLTSTSVQGEPMPELPPRWDPKSGLGMPPEFFNSVS